MQLTLYTDYSLRVLLYLSQMPKATVTIIEIADFYKISKNHLVKVVHHLVRCGFIISSRGKGGGIQLAKPADEITFAEVVLKTETNFYLVECLNEASNRCVISKVCVLHGILQQAMQAFLKVLQQYTLATGSKPAFNQQIIQHLILKDNKRRPFEDQ